MAGGSSQASPRANSAGEGHSFLVIIVASPPGSVWGSNRAYKSAGGREYYSYAALFQAL